MPSNPTNRTNILAEADHLVNGVRDADYGDPIDDFATTGDLWTTYIRRIIDRRQEVQIKPHDVAVMMMLLKIARLSWTPEKRDHWTDAIGYGACGWDCEVQEEGLHDAQ